MEKLPKEIDRRTPPKNLSLGKIVNEIVINQVEMMSKDKKSQDATIAVATGGLGGLMGLSYRNKELKDRQESLYRELDKREQEYRLG